MKKLSIYQKLTYSFVIVYKSLFDINKNIKGLISYKEGEYNYLLCFNNKNSALSFLQDIKYKTVIYNHKLMFDTDLTDNYWNKKKTIFV